ncbi:hypothetical protein Tco_1410335 [Tanacetum coccineum]
MSEPMPTIPNLSSFTYPNPNSSASPSFTQDDTSESFIPEPTQPMPTFSQPAFSQPAVHFQHTQPTQTNTTGQQYPNNVQSQQFQQFQTASISANNAKFPYLEKDKYEIWAMKMEYWIQNADHNLWRIVQQGNSPKSWEKMANGNNELFIHLSHLMEQVAVHKERTEDEEDTLLKQQFTEFSVTEEEGLHKGYDRFQKILSQLNQVQARQDNDDINLKFLRALPFSWSQVALALKTRGGLESMSFDDLYNKLRSLELDVRIDHSYGVKAAAAPTHSALSELPALPQSLIFLNKQKNEPDQDMIYEDFDQKARRKKNYKSSTCPDLTEESQQEVKNRRTKSFGLSYSMVNLSDQAAENKTGKVGEDLTSGRSLQELGQVDNYSMSTRTKIGLGFKEYFGENEVFDLSRPSTMYPEPIEQEVNPLYSRFVKAGEMHAVPPSITGTYMPAPYNDKSSDSATYASCDSSLKTKTKDFPPAVDIKTLPESDIEDPNSTAGSPSFSCSENVKSPRIICNKSGMNNRNVCKNNSVRVKKCFVCGSKLHLIKDCDFYNCVDSVPCKSKAASVPAGSRNSSASVTADGSDPAASRNRPAVNSAGRPKPTERVGQPAGWSKRPAPVSAGRPVSAGWLNPAARPYFQTHIALAHYSLSSKMQNLLNSVGKRELRGTIAIPEPHNKMGVSITNPHNKTPYELISGKVPQIGHLKPFGCQVTILNTSDYLGKFEGKADEGTQETNINAGTQDTDSDSEVDEQVIVVPSFPSNSFAGPSSSNGPSVIERNADYAEELAKLQRQEYEAKDAVARYGYLDPAGIDSAIRDPAGIDSAGGVSAGSPSAGSDPAGGNPADSFQLAARIEAIRQFLAFALYGILWYKSADVKSSLSLWRIVVKALYGLHQDLRAWDILLVQVYVDDIIFGSTNKAWCDEFEVLMKGEFEMSAMGEMNFFLSWKPTDDMIMLDFLIGDRKSTTGDVQLSWHKVNFRQCTEATIVATLPTEAEYVQLLLLCTLSTICIVKNPVFHQRTKHIEIRHHFIRDANEKNLIQVLKIHTDDNVADLLTKAFDGPRFAYLVVHIGMVDMVVLLVSTNSAGSYPFSADSLFLLVAMIMPAGSGVHAGGILLLGIRFSADRVSASAHLMKLLFGWVLCHYHIDFLQVVSNHAGGQPTALTAPHAAIAVLAVEENAAAHEAAVPNPVSPVTGWRPWPSVPAHSPIRDLTPEPASPPTPPAQNVIFEVPLVFGPAPRPARDVDPDVIESIIFGPQPRTHGYVDPVFVEPTIFGPHPRPDNYLEPEDLDNLLSMEDDTTHDGFHMESPVRPDDAPTPTANAVGRAEDLVLLTSLSEKLDRCMGRIDSLETELGTTKKIMGGAILTLVSRVKKLEKTVKQLRPTSVRCGRNAKKEEIQANLSAGGLPHTAVSESAGPSVAADKGKAPMPDLDIPAEFLAEDAQASQRFEDEQASERLVQQLQAEGLA